ncbi:MAG: HAD-IA family hydrolase [Patescibacteria group bacterium]|nr:HAD-IA family hydrolase [Patescibacteria group bacterium]
MIKAILFDLDGLIITGSSKLFSERLSEKENISMEQVSEFFINKFRKCSFGKADLKEKITPYLIKWGYKGTFDDLLKFWFESDNKIDKEVIGIVKDLRSKDIKCHIATRQEKYRKDYIWNKLELKNEFDGIFCTCDIGYDKSDREYWDYVLEELNLKPEEVMFFCDSQKNVDNANSFGIKSYYYEGIYSLEDKIRNL